MAVIGDLFSSRRPACTEIPPTSPTAKSREPRTAAPAAPARPTHPTRDRPPKAAERTRRLLAQMSSPLTGLFPDEKSPKTEPLRIPKDSDRKQRCDAHGLRQPSRQ